MAVRHLFALMACVIVPAASRAENAAQDGSLQPGPGVRQVNENGFGDRYNSIAWSMLWWKGKLYVGTYRASSCLRAVQWSLPYPPSDPDLVCPPDPLDLPLQAEIWRHTPETELWERVYHSPQVPIPGRPDKFVGRDIGYRDMIVFTEPDGTEAMYVSGVSGRVLYPDLPPPRLLRSADGVHFEAVPQRPGTVLGSTLANNFRSLAVFNKRLYVTLGSFWGDGRLLEADNPRLGNNAFRFVTPPGMRVFSVTSYRNQLYVGTTDTVNGYGIYRTSAIGPRPYYFRPIVTGGAFNPGKQLEKPSSVISMVVFRDRLYAGTDGAIDLVRVNPDDTWNLVVGAPRLTPDGFRVPLSGLGARYGWPYNILTWRMAVHDDKLFIGMFDRSSFLKDDPSAGPLKPYMGAKLYATRDGRNFSSLAPNFLDGDFFNYGIRTLVSTPLGLFLGTANDWTGTEVWRLD